MKDYPNVSWVVMTVNRPVSWARSDYESWSFVPPHRYIINAEHLDKFEDHLETVSDLKSSAFYHPWSPGKSVDKQSILIERYRNRGIGDILFMTGPMSWMSHQSGGSLKIYFKSLVDKGPVLNNHPALHLQMPFYGTTMYDSLPLYTYHWFLETATELDEEPDQLNVYDNLFKQFGVDPESVSPEFKRPSVVLDAKDERALYALYRFIHAKYSHDLRSVPYAVLAPMTHGFIRATSYQLWIDLAKELTKFMPVVVIGTIGSQTPATDMEASEAFQTFDKMDGVINLIGNVPLRTVMALIKHSRFLIGLDSAPIYMAQGCGVPAVSLWGAHNPSRRIGYDDRMMNLAIWKRPACPFAGCGAWRSFPVSKCPLGTEQKVCQVLQSISVHDVMEKVEIIRRSLPQ